MNAKANSIRIVPVLITAGRIQVVDKPVGSARFLRVVLPEDALPLNEPRVRLSLATTDQRTGEFWETLSYVAIWLCGLIGIALCFL
jgi:hypothetical protein